MGRGEWGEDVCVTFVLSVKGLSLSCVDSLPKNSDVVCIFMRCIYVCLCLCVCTP